MYFRKCMTLPHVISLPPLFLQLFFPLKSTLGHRIIGAEILPILNVSFSSDHSHDSHQVEKLEDVTRERELRLEMSDVEDQVVWKTFYF